MTSIGLRTHIWNNNLKSGLLMAGFPFLLFAIYFALDLVGQVYGAVDQEQALALDAQIRISAARSVAAIPFLILAAGLWFAIAFVFHQKMIDLSTGARRVERSQEPLLYNLLENLSISRGIQMPQLRVIETDALNAYASGLSETKAVITVTRGLLEALSDDELEAVLAHELSHVINRDVRLLVVAVIFVGIISFVSEIVFRGFLRGGLMRSGGSRRGKSGNAGVIVLIAMAILALAWFLAIVIRFAMSRSREYMADAGAVELTKNPDAMIAALEKISGRSTIKSAPAEVRQMFIHAEVQGSSPFSGLFATHPPIEKRIQALEAFAGGQRSSSASSVPEV